MHTVVVEHRLIASVEHCSSSINRRLQNEECDLCGRYGIDLPQRSRVIWHDSSHQSWQQADWCYPSQTRRPPTQSL